MSVQVTLEYKRDGHGMTSSGRILSNDNGLVTEEGDFTGLHFKDMMKHVAAVLRNWKEDETPDIDVVVQRTDRGGLQPYKMDKQTVELLRKDPVAGIEALSFDAPSPSNAVAQVEAARSPPAPTPVLRRGHETLIDAFGESVGFRVRGHELECPGCGFWGMFTTPGLLKDPSRAGTVFKTAFVCPKKCATRFIVSCHAAYGYVDVSFLLEQTKLEKFYLPRAWNGGRPWVSRQDLQQKYDEYKKEKESL